MAVALGRGAKNVHLQPQIHLPPLRSVKVLLLLVCMKLRYTPDSTWFYSTLWPFFKILCPYVIAQTSSFCREVLL